MLLSLVVLMSAPASAETLPVALGAKTGVLSTPSAMGVGLTLKATAEGEENTVTWTNEESSTISVVCAKEAKAPDDAFVDVLLLTVGDEKWALAAGSNVKFACPEGKPATVTDMHGTTIGAFKGGVMLSVTRAKSRSAR